MNGKSARAKLRVSFIDDKKRIFGIDEAGPKELCEGIEELSHELKEKLEKLLK